MDRKIPMPDPRARNPRRRKQLRQKILATYTECGICGLPVDKTLPPYQPGSPELDEIVPVARGGDPYDINNLQLSHRKCNRNKSDKMPGFVNRVEIEKYPLSNDWSEILK